MSDHTGAARAGNGTGPATASAAAVRHVFDAAADLPPQERAAYLDMACDGDRALRREVESLLSALNVADDVLADPPALGPAPATASDPTGAVIGGRYKLLEQIGEGGFGVVFMAEQERPVRRRVAVKVIKPGMDTRQVVARFEAERQALAMMDHPNIAKVLDAGATESGRPYFVMELVRGTPVTDYCDKHQLTTSARLRLFVDVCHAVQHAHQKGIIHRDLKPTNVLITVQDGRPVPKVIDFGIAKATQTRLTEKTLFTEFRQLMGTPEYMSPEQAESDGALDIDTRSDVYSLGVLLYSLLTGSTPFEPRRLRSAAYAEVCRIIREEEPPRPSTRLSTLAGDTLSGVADRRGTEAKKLGQLLRGELDWVVMRALEKDRSRRYESASELARDVERYLRDEPVEACPPSVGYRLRKLARRHRPAVGTVATLLAMLLAATAVSTHQAWRATRAKDAEATARGLADAAAAKALEEKRNAEILVAESLVLRAATLTEARRWPEAADLYRRAYADLSQRGAPTASADLGQWNLDRLAPPPLAVWHGHGGRVGGVAVSPDGRRAISVDDGGSVVLREVLTGRTIRSWHSEGAYDGYSGVTFCPDGRHAATVESTGPGMVHVWDVETGREVQSIRPEGGYVHWPAFSPDGTRIAAGAVNGTVWIWDWRKGEIVQKIVGNGRPAMGVAFSPDGDRLAVVGHQDNSVRVWDVAGTDPRLPLHLQGPPRLLWSAADARAPVHVAFSPDGRRLITGGWSTALETWDAWKGGRQKTLVVEDGLVTGVAFAGDNRSAVSCGFDGTVRLWDTETGQQVRAFAGHVQPAGGLAVCPDGRRVLSAGWDRTVRLWDLYAQPETRTWTAHEERTPSLAFSPDGRMLLSGGWDGWLKLWDARSGRLLTILGGHEGGKGGAGIAGEPCFTPDGMRVVSAGFDGTVQVWDLAGAAGLGEGGTSKPTAGGARRTRLLGSHDGRRIIASALSRDGQVLATAGEDETIKLWTVDAEDAGPRWVVPAGPVVVRTLDFSVDGRRLLCGRGQEPAWLLDVDAGRLIDMPFGAPGGAPISGAARFSPDGRWVAALPGPDYVLHFWADTLHGPAAASFTLGGRGEEGQELHFSCDGTLLVTSGRLTQLWDVPGRRPLLAAGGLGGQSVLSPDGARLAGASHAGDFRGVLHLSDLRSVRRCRESAAVAERARQVLASGPVRPGPTPPDSPAPSPQEAAAWAGLGQWYADRDANDWAVACFERARFGGAHVPALSMAHCYWSAGRLADARREFLAAAGNATTPQERLYLELCVRAVSRASRR